MKTSRLFVLFCCSFAAIAARADYCSDIKAQCSKNFDLDMKACGNPNDRQGQQCVANAHQRLAECVKSTNCK